MEGAGRLLILIGFFIIIFGLLLMFWHRLPYAGRLPGDIFLEKDGLTFFFPLVTSLIISVILTVILNIALRLFR
ncbi:MAG: DUF2905 domain-containing protein [Dehalococcoidia bacterium]|nr:DUF2905 domain-containing protein [Dehalococcoidia bacterium]